MMMMKIFCKIWIMSRLYTPVVYLYFSNAEVTLSHCEGQVYKLHCMVEAQYLGRLDKYITKSFFLMFFFRMYVNL